MAKKVLLIAAGVALMAATSAVQAADAPTAPVTITPVTPVAAAPTTAIQFDTTLRNSLYFFEGLDEYDIDWESDVVIDFQRPASWSFQVLGILDFYNWDPIEFDFDLAARTYRSFGNLTVGAFAGIEGDVCCGGGDLYDRSVGFDIEFHAGNFAAYTKHWIDFEGGFEDVNTIVWVAFDVGERLTIGGGIDDLVIDAGGINGDIQIEAWARLALGNLTPYAFLEWYPQFGDVNGGLGIDFQHRIGTGPLSLIGNAEVEFSNFGGGVDLDIIFGIRFDRGEVNTPWWWKPLGLNGMDNNTI